MAIDVERLLAEALTKHGIRLDPHDPAIVLVTLNRLVLEDAVKCVTADIRKATREYEEALQLRRGSKRGPAVHAQPYGVDGRFWRLVWPLVWVCF